MLIFKLIVFSTLEVQKCRNAEAAVLPMLMRLAEIRQKEGWTTYY
jgi:hypothetical protein